MHTRRLENKQKKHTHTQKPSGHSPGARRGRSQQGRGGAAADSPHRARPRSATAARGEPGEGRRRPVTGGRGAGCGRGTWLPIGARGIRHHKTLLPSRLAPDPKFWGWARARVAQRGKTPPFVVRGTKGLFFFFQVLALGHADGRAPSAAHSGDRQGGCGGQAACRCGRRAGRGAGKDAPGSRAGERDLTGLENRREGHGLGGSPTEPAWARVSEDAGRLGKEREGHKHCREVASRRRGRGIHLSWGN